MAIDLFPRLKRLQIGSYDNCVILTYTADLYFYEQVVWRALRSRGCCNNLVLMDSRQYVSTLDTNSASAPVGQSLLRMAGGGGQGFSSQDYSSNQNEKAGRLIIGSGNLTVRGFSTNWEVFSEITSTADSRNGNVFTEAWRLVEESAKGATKAVRRQLEQMRKTSGTILSSGSDDNWPRLLFAAPNQPTLIKQLNSLIGHATVKRLIIVSPFFDPRLQAVKEFESEFSVKDIIAVVQQKTVSFPGGAAKARTALAVHDFVPPDDGKSGYLHAKAYVLQTATAEYCVWGSPNCSMAAPMGQGNYEAVLVTRGKPGDGISALGLEESLATGQKINPAKLVLAKDKVPQKEAVLSAISAEVDHGNITVTVAPLRGSQNARRAG